MNLSERLKSSKLLRPGEAQDAADFVRSITLSPHDDELRGKLGATRRDGARSGALGGRLSKLLSGRRLSNRSGPPSAGLTSAYDHRQNVVVTVFYQSHAGAGGGKLPAHGRYLSRDGAGPDGEPGEFYDADFDGVDTAQTLADWAERDKRHFRLMLAPESGARIDDLKDFVRATMLQMERDLGVSLAWVAVNHHNTDNPHVHVILRGATREGADLIIPRGYVGLGLRNAARDVATQMLGERSAEDDRLRLDRETRAERVTRLDELLEMEIRSGTPQRIQGFGIGLEPTLRAALRNRVRELAKLGLAQERKRDRFTFDVDWKSRLEAIGQGIDLRRRLGREAQPGLGKLRLYAPEMGRVVGSVVEVGSRGENGKGFVIVVDSQKRPILANVRNRDIDGLAVGALVSLEVKPHPGPGIRLLLDRLSETPIASQTLARAETELDRDILRANAGRPQRLPNTREIKTALSERVAWHLGQGHGHRDLTGRFDFDPGALPRLRDEEYRAAEVELSRTAGKRSISAVDGIEREWRVRGFVRLQQGRFVALERNDAVALVRASNSVSLTQGKSYSIAATNGKISAAPALGLER